MTNKTTASDTPDPKPKSKDVDSQNLSQRLQDIFYAVWSLVGVIVILILLVAVFGSGSWTENLHLTSGSQAEEQTAGQQPAPQQPTQEQLQCVSDEIGQKRFAKLQQGEQPTEEETAAIEQCLQDGN